VKDLHTMYVKRLCMVTTNEMTLSGEVWRIEIKNSQRTKIRGKVVGRQWMWLYEGYLQYWKHAWMMMMMICSRNL
jgi:hypothetical protein